MRAEETEQSFGPQAPSVPVHVTERPPSTYDERLNHILEAATDVMARVGYERASMRAIARAADVCLSGLYHYVPNKERMLFLIQSRTFNALVNNLREKLIGVDDPRDQLDVFVRAHVNYFAAHMDALKVCSHELDSLSGASYEETRRLRDEYYRLARGIVERLLTARAPEQAADVHVCTMLLFGMLNWLYRWYDPKRGRAPSTVAQHLVNQYLHGLLGG
jgi:AcrR family transcriptional regulator